MRTSISPLLVLVAALSVAPAERIAVFDNDGTLWPEQPVYTQFMFGMDRAKRLE